MEKIYNRKIEMRLLYQFILVTVIILVCIAYLSASMGNEMIEKFETYTYGPYDFRTTGSDPLTFYQYPVYRAPFDYPYKFYSSYPYPYLSYHDNSL